MEELRNQEHNCKSLLLGGIGSVLRCQRSNQIHLDECEASAPLSSPAIIWWTATQHNSDVIKWHHTLQWVDFLKQRKALDLGVSLKSKDSRLKEFGHITSECTMFSSVQWRHRVWLGGWTVFHSGTWRDNTRVKTLALHSADSSSIPSTCGEGDPEAEPVGSPEHKQLWFRISTLH